MIWQFDHSGEWTAWSKAKEGLQYRIQVCDDGTFDISKSDHGLVSRSETFQMLRNAKAFCDTAESVHGISAAWVESFVRRPWEIVMSEPTLLARLNDGCELPIQPCNCGHCNNEWFMAALSPEWMPSYCPYCGIKFLRKTTDDEPDDFLPSSVALPVQYGVRLALPTGSEFVPTLRWGIWEHAADYGEDEVASGRATGFWVFEESAV